MSDEFRYYSVENVAELIGVSEQWIWRQCRANAIPHHRFGRQYRFSTQDLRDLNSQTAVAVTDRQLAPTTRSVPRR